jgi:hypothetical protein
MMQKNNKTSKKQQVFPLDLLRKIITGDIQGQKLKGAIQGFNAQLDGMQNIRELYKFFDTGTRDFSIGKTLLSTINTFFNLFFENLDKQIISLLIKIVKFVLENMAKYKSDGWSQENSENLYATLIVCHEIKFTFNEKALSYYPANFIKVLVTFLKNCDEKSIKIFVNKLGLKFLRKLDLYINHNDKNVRDDIFQKTPRNDFKDKYLKLIDIIIKTTWKFFPLKEILEAKSFSKTEEILTKWLVFTEWLEIHSNKSTHNEEKKKRQQFYKKLASKFNLLNIIELLNSLKNSRQNLPDIINHIVENKGMINLKIKIKNSKIKCRHIVINTALSEAYINERNFKSHQNFLVICAQYQGLTIKFLQNLLQLYGGKEIKVEKNDAVKNLKELFKGICNIFSIKYLDLLIADPNKHSILCKLIEEKKAIMQVKCLNDNDVIYIMPIKEVLQQIHYVINNIYNTFPNKITSKFSLDTAKQAICEWHAKTYKLGFSLSCLLDKLNKIDVTNSNTGTNKVVQEKKSFIDYIKEKAQIYVDNIYEHILIDKMVSSLDEFCEGFGKFLSQYEGLVKICYHKNLIFFEDSILHKIRKQLSNIEKVLRQHKVCENKYKKMIEISQQLRKENSNSLSVTVEIIESEDKVLYCNVIYIIMPPKLTHKKCNSKKQVGNANVEMQYLSFKLIFNNNVYITGVTPLNSIQRKTSYSKNGCKEIDIGDITYINVQHRDNKDILNKFELLCNFPEIAQQFVVKFYNHIRQETRVQLQKLDEITTKINVISFKEKCKILQKIFANQGAILEYNNKPICISHFKSKVINIKNHEHYYKLLELFLRFDKWKLQDYQNVVRFFNNCKLITNKGIKNPSLFQGQEFYASQLYKKLQEFIQRYNKKFSKKAKQSSIFVLKLNKNQNPNECLISFEKKKGKKSGKKDKGQNKPQTQDQNNKIK